jgi:glutathione S-transferase
MMKLYYSKGSCSLAVRIVINEIGLTCEYESVDLRTKITGTGGDFLSVNTKGSVPTLLTNQGDVLTENAVIQQYLADTSNAYTLLPKVGEMKRYRVLEWLNYVSTELHKGCSPLFNPNVSTEMKENVFIPAIKARLTFIDQHLAKNAYLAGDHFTLPDGYLFVVISWMRHFKVSLKEWANIEKYIAELMKRPSIHKSLVEEGIVTENA